MAANNLVAYRTAVDRAERVGSNARRDFRIICAMFVVGIAINAYELTQILGEKSDQYQDYAAPMAIVAITLALLAFAAMWTRLRRYGQRLMALARQGTIYPAPPHSLRAIRVAIGELAATLAPNSYSSFQLPLYVHRSQLRAPAVVEFNGEVSLLLPLGFIALHGRRPSHGRAMLAHELAHVVQRDASLWSLSKAARPPFFAAGLASNLIALFLLFMGGQQLREQTDEMIDEYEQAISSGSPEYNDVGPEYVQSIRQQRTIELSYQVARGLMVCAVLLFFVAAWTRIRRARHRSEFLADWGAAVCVGTSEYRDVLHEYISETGDRSTHPSRAQRIAFVSRLEH